MKKKWIIFLNVLIIVVIALFVIMYATLQRRNEYDTERSGFENSTVAMEKVTENYLEGEQRICDVWGKHIKSAGMTLDEAIEFVRGSHVHAQASAHIIFIDGEMSGKSTIASSIYPDRYDVSYKDTDLFPDLDKMGELGEKINITRAFTNPMNGVQSIAFCNKVTLKDDGGADRDALLLRILPVSELEGKWVFPRDKYENAEFSIIDSFGNYVIKGKSFENNTFFDYYKSYNNVTAPEMDSIVKEITGGSGSLEMLDSCGEKMIIAHTRVVTTDGWILLSSLPAADLNEGTIDWLFITVVTGGLVILFLVDLSFLIYFNKRLQTTAKEADEANHAKTNFLSSMSHDIRTPMNAIIGMTAIAERNLNDREAVKESLRKITLASNHLLTLINDILDISKIESGKLNLIPVAFSIKETADNLVNLSQTTVKEKNIDFSFRISGMEVEYLYADMLRLNQIYINILSNAVKYTEYGGRVDVDLAEAPGSLPGTVRLTYTVSDTGIGMSEEFMARLYQPFSRQTDTRVNSVQGTGLGLAITKRMVDLMGGTIECRSKQGEGTTFTVSLELQIAEKHPDAMRLDPIDVLLVDDDEITLETAKETLTSLGAKADTSPSGEDAVRKTIARHGSGDDYDVIIVDWKMPGMDGVQVVREIREKAGIDVPILLISAYDWSDIEEEAKSAGASGFISKPLFRSTLYEKVNDLLGIKDETAEAEEDNSAIAGMNVLVAEDNDVNWEVISTILQMYGITSERAENGQICVDKVREAEVGKYDLCFMDVQMPVMNGLDAARAIRALGGKRSEIPIIAMTADAFAENVSDCMEAGMNGHIAKPVDIKVLLKEITRIKEEKNRN